MCVGSIMMVACEGQGVFDFCWAEDSGMSRAKHGPHAQHDAGIRMGD